MTRPLDTDQLLATGALSGPYRRSRPYQLPALARLLRWITRRP
jgi:hypothetical protein